MAVCAHKKIVQRDTIRVKLAGRGHYLLIISLLLINSFLKLHPTQVKPERNYLLIPFECQDWCGWLLNLCLLWSDQLQRTWLKYLKEHSKLKRIFNNLQFLFFFVCLTIKTTYLIIFKIKVPILEITKRLNLRIS